MRWWVTAEDRCSIGRRGAQLVGERSPIEDREDAEGIEIEVGGIHARRDGGLDDGSGASCARRAGCTTGCGMIVGSFLVKDLLVDWRIGERHFRHLLVDADVSQNVGNWQWVAGTGPDASPLPPHLQPGDPEPEVRPHGAYIRRWVPELAPLDDKAIHAPWDVAPLELAAAGVTLGGEYPHPVVNHAEARSRALAAYAAVGDGKTRAAPGIRRP